MVYIMRNEMTFYELQQRAGNTWRCVGYFKNLKAAEEHEKKFNVKVMIGPTRIVEREFTGD